MSGRRYINKEFVKFSATLAADSGVSWSGAGGYLIDCADASRDVNEDFPALDSASRAVFRINRKVIVLNNPEDGGLWLPDEDMVQVDNWDQINSDLEKEETEEDDTTRNADETQAERSENNTPPDAVDDSFGVRPGRSASLPVIANDTDPDGDVLVASPTSQPDLGEVVAGCAMGASSAMIITLGTGVGSGFVIDGRGKACYGLSYHVDKTAVNFR